MQRISKSFPGVQALCAVDLDVRPGEVHALLGENGAGKSTLIKILGGVYQPDQGSILLDGRTTAFHSPRAARGAGVAIIYQEFSLVPSLTVAENLCLGREPHCGGWVRSGLQRRQAERALQQLGVQLPLDATCDSLSVAQQQLVEIAKALTQEARVLVMDEPTTTLMPDDVARLFHVIDELRQQGIAIIYISHRLEEIDRLADRVTVLRDGQNVATWARGAWTRPSLIEAMVGRQLEQEFPKQVAPRGAPRLVVRDLHRGDAVRGVSFQVHAGEVLGLTGLVGSGRTETARLIFGADRATRGTVALDGRTLRLRSPRDAIQAGICLLTEDRKRQGLLLGRSVLENFALPNLPSLATAGVVNVRRERAAWAGHAQTLQIKVPTPETLAAHLSGGNQQKVVLAKWLQRQADVIIFDEPTRGIDVGAKYEIYLLINQLAQAGKAILMISSELPEVLGMSDRILVMHQGRITGEITDPRQATPAQIMRYAIG
jgi:ABC-type sugar transport system ATPase subunit